MQIASPTFCSKRWRIAADVKPLMNASLHKACRCCSPVTSRYWQFLLMIWSAWKNSLKVSPGCCLRVANWWQAKISLGVLSNKSSMVLMAESKLLQSSTNSERSADVKFVRRRSLFNAGFPSVHSSSSWSMKLSNVFFQCFQSLVAESPFGSISIFAGFKVFAVDDIVAQNLVFSKLYQTNL